MRTMVPLFTNRPGGRERSPSVHASPSRGPLIDLLESRTLLSSSVDILSVEDQKLVEPPAMITVAATQPSILATSPADGDTDVRRDIFIGADLSLPNGALAISTVNG